MSLPGDQISVSVVPRTHARMGYREALPILVNFKVGNRILPKFEDVKILVQSLLDESLKETVRETEEWISRFAPMLTGDLRASLISFLKKSIPPASVISELRGIRLVLGAGANVKYARYVNKMTTKQVRHPIDPQAIGNYHDKMIAYGQKRFKINIDKAIYKFNRG